MTLKVPMLAIWFALPALCDWPRLVITGKGHRVDNPSAHPLAYFSGNPWLHNEADWEICNPCTPEKRLADARKKKAKAEVKRIGEFGRFPVYDVLYFFDGKAEPSWKSILVKTGEDIYQEIHHDHPIEARLNPSFALTIGQDRYVCVFDNYFKGGHEEQCYWIGFDYVQRVDDSSVWDIAQKTAPPGMEVVREGMHAEYTFPDGKITVRYYDSQEHCCIRGKGVNVWFSLDRRKLLVTRAEAFP